MLHSWWRRKFHQAREEAFREIAQLRQEQEQDKVQRQAKQELVLDSMVEGLLLLDGSGRIQLANRAFRRLFPAPGEIRSKTILEVLRWPELSQLIKELGATQAWVNREIRFPGPDEVWFQISAASITDKDAEGQGTVLVFHDVSQLKRLERTRQEFVANVSHELRTPLSHIKGYAETLLSGAKDNPEVSTRFLQTIERNAERLRLLIEDLLTISEIESGRVRLDLKPVSVASLVSRVLNDFQTRARVRGVTLQSEMVEAEVRADAGRLEQVVSNLVDNAIKYGRQGGRVTVGSRLLDGGRRAEIFIRDDGPGLPPEALERVFERFYRVDKARSREQGGTGLGLSIVKHLIQSHGGRVWVRSEMGKGATFYFTLPLRDENGQSELSPGSSR